MKKFYGFLFLVFVVMVVAGCGGGGRGAAIPAATTITPSNIVLIEPPAPTNQETGRVSYVSSSYYIYDPIAGEGKAYSYDFQQAGAGSDITVGVRVSLTCSSGYYYSGCSQKANIPVIFRVWDGSSRIGSGVTIQTNPASIATTTISLAGISVSPGSAKDITIKASVENPIWIDANYGIPEDDMTVRVVPSDFVPVYSASVDQNVAVNVIAGEGASGYRYRVAGGGMGYSYGGYASVRVKNTGNTAWWGFQDPLSRVYAILDNSAATTSQFFSNTWYSAEVASDLTYGSYVLPGQITTLGIYLSAPHTAPGNYTECFKLATKPSSIDNALYKYRLVDPIEIAGSHFCLDITVQPESLARATGSDSDSDPQLAGKPYWESQNRDK